VENPYWQYFTGETHLQTRAPMDPSSLTRWRRRIGEEGVELLLKLTIEAARQGGFVERTSFCRRRLNTPQIGRLNIPQSEQ
jgi:IS5 family transposase